jgi:N-methylhydantoinase A/oxoprolinase/acetone carboxylase beta subunit
VAPAAARSDRTVDAQGRIVTALDADSVRHALGVFRDEGVEAIAICLLNSFRNGTHEQQARDLALHEWPGLWVSCSSEIAPIGRIHAATVVPSLCGLRTVPCARSRALQELGLNRC